MVNMVFGNFRLILCAFFLTFITSESWAQNNDVRSLINAGEYVAARQAAKDQGATAIDLAVAEALIDHHRGERDGAIRRLRAILRDYPGLIPVRQLLANFLAAKGDFEAAEFHYERLVELDNNTDRRRSYRNALNLIRSKKPYGFTSSFAIVPSSNINRGTSGSVFRTSIGDFDIDPESKGKTGVGLALNVGAFRRFSLPDAGRLRFDLKLGGVIYTDSQFNQGHVTTSLTYGKSKSGKFWSVTPELRRVWLDASPYYDLGAVTLNWGMRLNQKTGLGLGFRAEHRDYNTATYLSGERYQVGATLQRRVSPRVSVQGSLTLATSEAKAARFQYDSIKLGAGATRSWGSGLRVSAALSHEIRPYRGDFTGVTFPRDDRITSIDVRVVNDRWTFGGAAPTYSCRLTWAKSNIEFYDYDVQECTIGFTRQF